MNVQMQLTQSQLLQRNSGQLSDSSSVQKNAKQVKEDKTSYNDRTAISYDKGTILELTEGMNEFLKPMDTSLKFEFHDKLEKYYVTVIDNETDEVVKEIPAEKMLDLYAAMAESLGFLVDEKV